MPVTRRSVEIAAADLVPDNQVAEVFAASARKLRDDVIAAGEAPKVYTTFVDGRAGASEEIVRTDGTGRVLYRFSSLADATAFALAFVRARSPVDSGAYRNAWLVAVNGQLWAGDVSAIPRDAEITIVNPEPYARKVDLGRIKMSVPPQIIENARQAVRAAYPAIKAERAFVNLPSSFGVGIAYPVPWLLKGRPGKPKPTRRDNHAGMPITYPALVMKGLS